LSLGYLPAVNNYYPIDSLKNEEIFFSTELMYSKNSKLMQLGTIVNKELIFPKSYPYTSSTTKILRENFKELYKECVELFNLKKTDLIVDIGSNDGNLLSNFKKNHLVLGVTPELIGKIAIKKGIKESKNDLICYTHADLQTDLNDVLTAYEIFLNNGAENLFIKGFRFERNFLDSIFTNAMTVLISVMFMSKLTDIHAQPNFFNRKIINNLDFVPDDFSIDIYLLLAAKKASQKLIRFNVLFNKRLHGIGNNERFLSKILHASKIILSSLRIVFSRKF